MHSRLQNRQNQPQRFLHLQGALLEKWRAISQDEIRRLIRSIPPTAVQSCHHARRGIFYFTRVEKGYISSARDISIAIMPPNNATEVLTDGDSGEENDICGNQDIQQNLKEGEFVVVEFDGQKYPGVVIKLPSGVQEGPKVDLC
ncbi:hypothetical protein C0J52_08648 [Blattella germanica]|nr:hypothetical protein C0J52_08648 [Blattella germanica]